MKCFILLLILAINLYETQAYYDYNHYQGYVPGPPGYVAEVEGECGCCPPPCCCVCVETSAPTPTTTIPTTPSTTTPTTTSTASCFPREATIDPGHDVFELLLDVCVVVDASGSVTSEDWAIIQDFIARIFVDSFREFIGMEIRVGMVTYGTIATMNWGLDSPETMSAEALEEAIYKLPQIGTMRNTADGLRVAATQIFNVPADRSEAPNWCLVIATGKANIMEDKLPVYAEALKNASRVMVFKVGEEANFDDAELKLIASCNNWINRIEDFDNVELDEIIGGQGNRVHEEPTHPSVDPSPGTTKPTPPTEKECFCCCPPPPGYPDTCGFGHH